MSNLVFAETTSPGLQALEFARESGHDVTLLCSPIYDFFVSATERERARSLADRVITVDDLHDVAAVLAGLQAAGVEPAEVDAVLTTLHFCAHPAAVLAKTIGARGTSPEAILAAKDKGACRQILGAAGIPNLGFGVVTELTEALEVAGAIGYPVVVKPVNGLGKVITTVARSPRDVRAHFAAAAARVATLEPGVAAELDDRFIIEEMALGPLYSVEVAADGTTITPLVVVRRKTGRDNPVLELGSTVPCGLATADEQELRAYAARICRALGLDVGLFHVEVIMTVGGPRLVEVNPRIAGGAIPDLVRAATGCNLFEVLVALSTGAAAPGQPLVDTAAASHSFLAAADDCTVRSDLPADWFEAFRPRIHSGWTTVEAGSRLRRMDGNFDVYGVVRVIAADFARAEQACTDLTTQIAETLGITLAAIALVEP